MLVECKSSAEEGCTNDSENTDSETSDSERLDTQKENLDSTYVEGTTLGSTTSDEDFSNATSDPDITLEVPGTSDTQSKRPLIMKAAADGQHLKASRITINITHVA
ncbi:unnamed protein product [Arctia plantaginis]|uniref:Uncharacterized protein n=1 Tax=Arctia plantaginis TaxID=874455 RepID=A0A8S1A1X9_ARCPL|nr:unnamed protein product [Arctia plantaginis]